MLKYICFWKLRDDAGEEGRVLVRHYLDELPRRVGYVKSWSWGEALGTEGEAYSCGLVAEFDDAEGLRGYLAHPEHLAVERLVAPYLAAQMSSHYEST